jgi:hypothetical protein
MPSGDEKTTKKVYHEPQLRVYGDIREVTAGSTPGGVVDGGAPAKT